MSLSPIEVLKQRAPSHKFYTEVMPCYATALKTLQIIEQYAGRLKYYLNLLDTEGNQPSASEALGITIEALMENGRIRELVIAIREALMVTTEEMPLQEALEYNLRGAWRSVTGERLQRAQTSVQVLEREVGKIAVLFGQLVDLGLGQFSVPHDVTADSTQPGGAIYSFTQEIRPLVDLPQSNGSEAFSVISPDMALHTSTSSVQEDAMV
ncbi:MAG: hypothetical protein WCG83_04375 [Candidatus Peregrinibacteria bacterium]